MALTCVTITGADDATDPAELVKIGTEYPFVEWAILIGSNVGPRFPSVAWIRELVKHREATDQRMNLSLHVCGKFLREIASGHSSLYGRISSDLYAFSRVQLNWHGWRQATEVGVGVYDAFRRLRSDSPNWNPRLIFQFDGVNDELWRPSGAMFRCAGLFDRSHGAGVLPDEWPEASTAIECGYAGGLGPDNLEQEIPKIAEKASKIRPHWIDMETRVRTDDDSSMDLDRVRKCLEIAKPFVEA